MCDFVSWIEKKDKNGNTHIFFLKSNDIYNTERGRKLQMYCGDKRDLVGHGAIEDFYPESKGGKHIEWRWFDDPGRFPKVIARALVRGEMNMMGIPSGILTPNALEKYRVIDLDALEVRARKISAAARKREGTLDKAIAAKKSRLDYDNIYAEASDEYAKEYYMADDEYRNVTYEAFTKLMKNKKNIRACWRKYL